MLQSELDYVNLTNACLNKYYFPEVSFSSVIMPDGSIWNEYFWQLIATDKEDGA